MRSCLCFILGRASYKTEARPHIKQKKRNRKKEKIRGIFFGTGWYHQPVPKVQRFARQFWWPKRDLWYRFVPPTGTKCPFGPGSAPHPFLISESRWGLTLSFPKFGQTGS